MRQELRKAIDATKGLTTDELGELRTHISALLSLGPSSADRISGATNHSDWVLMGLVDFAKSKGEIIGVPQLTSGKHYDAWRAKLPTIHKYLAQCGNMVQQRAVLHMGLGLLYQNMTDIGARVSPRTMMAHIHRLPGVINREFPGYAENGLLTLLFRSEQHARQKQSRKPVQHGRKRTQSG